ncbi:MAG: dihydroorotase [Promethearchaeota archaeon]
MEAPISRLILTNGQIFTQNKIISGFLVIEGNSIQQIGEGAYIRRNSETIIDVQQALIIPGFIDMHVHFRDMEQASKETLESGSKGALHGGVTSVVTMPNTIPPLSTPTVLKKYWQKIKSQPVYCNIGYYASVKAGFSLSNIPEMKKLGIQGIKIYPGDFSEELELQWKDGWRSDLDPTEFSQKIPEILKNFQNEYPAWKKLFETAKEHDLLILFHPELPREANLRYKIYEHGLQIAKTEKVPNPHLFAHHVAHPVYTNELALVEMLISLLYKYFPDPTQAPHVHFVHVSSANVVEIIHLMLKQKGYPCSIEASPHHLFLNYDMLFSSENKAKVLVPLRSAEIQENLKKKWQENQIDTIGTDHAPHTLAEKQQDFSTAPSGFPSIDFAGQILLSQVFENQISLEQLVNMYSTRPAQLLKLNRKGIIAPQMDADLIVVRKTDPYKISQAQMKSKQKWTPWDSFQVSAEIEYVILGGHLVYDKSKDLCLPHGNFLMNKDE